MRLLLCSDFWWGVIVGVFGSLAIELAFVYLS